MAVKIGFVSLGCNKNLCDTENMMGVLAQNGFELTADTNNAEVIVVNTCGFIDSAKEESINTILEMAKYKSGKCRLLVACGCLVQRYFEEMKTELPEVDVLIGTTAIDKIADAVRDGLGGKKNGYIEDINKTVPPMPRISATPVYTAYLKIAEGCDNHCTYCAIPSIRGKYRSRDIEELLDEANELAESGVREIIVVAQDTTRYGIDLYGEKKLAELLKRLCRIDKIKWVRVHYCYPEEIDENLIETIRDEEKIVKYLDIPVQHGSDSVLRRMGRKTDRKSMEELVQRLRAEIPAITLRTSIIVGFPGETEKEFSELVSFLKEVRFDRVGAFKYSREEKTPAAKMPGQIDEGIKEQRYSAVMEVCANISEERNKEMIGKCVRVLAEGFEDNLWYGRSGGESIEIDPKIYFGAHRDIESGEFLQVLIKDADTYDLYGEEYGKDDQ